MKPLLLTTLFSLFFVTIYAQNKASMGKITDTTGEAIPFASAYQVNSRRGTSANAEGVCKLPIPNGASTLVISAVGYHSTILEVDLPVQDTIDVQLKKDSYALQEVIIGNGEDPAYQIIRNAIDKRKVHLNESGAYTAEVYIKGLQRLLKAPKKFLGVDVDEMSREMGLDS